MDQQLSDPSNELSQIKDNLQALLVHQKCSRNMSIDSGFVTDQSDGSHDNVEAVISAIPECSIEHMTSRDDSEGCRHQSPRSSSLKNPRSRGSLKKANNDTAANQCNVPVFNRSVSFASVEATESSSSQDSSSSTVDFHVGDSADTNKCRQQSNAPPTACDGDRKRALCADCGANASPTTRDGQFCERHIDVITTPPKCSHHELKRAMDNYCHSDDQNSAAAVVVVAQSVFNRHSIPEETPGELSVDTSVGTTTRQQQEQDAPPKANKSVSIVSPSRGGGGGGASSMAKSSWLLRLFESKLFDMSMAIGYLFNSKEQGVQAYIGESEALFGYWQFEEPVQFDDVLCVVF